MPTYAGYQAISTPDFSAPFREQMSGLMSKRAAEEAAKQKAEQEELKYQRAQNDKFDLEYNKAVQEIEAGGVVDSANKDFDSEIIGWSRGGVEKLHFFSKTATIPERRAAITNMKSDVLNLKTVVDNLGDIAEQQQAKIQEQGGTAWRQNLQMQKNKDLINLNNKDIVWGDDFRGYINTYDSEGNVTKSQSILNMVSAAKIQDQFVNLIDLDGAIEDKIKTAGDFTQAAGNYTISDVRQKDGYPEWFKATLNDITLQGKDNGRMVDLLMDGRLSESVTLDNGVDVDIFGHGIEDTKEMSQIYLDVLTDAEDTKGAELTEKEEEEIKSAIDKLTFIHTEKGGKTEYAIKADTREFIKEKIGEKIEFALGYKKTKSGDGGGSKGYESLSSTEKQGVETAWAVNQEWENKSGKFEGFKKNNLSYEWDPQGRGVWVTPTDFNKLDDEIQQIFGGKSEKILISNKRELAQFVGSSTPSSAMASYSTGIGLIKSGVRPGWMEAGDVQQPVTESTKRAREAAEEWKREKSQNVNKLKGGNVR